MRDSRSTGGRALPRWIWAAFLAVYAVAVPWYAADDFTEPRLWAFPAWAALSVAGGIALAILNAYVYLKVWPTTDNENGDGS